MMTVVCRVLSMLEWYSPSIQSSGDIDMKSPYSSNRSISCYKPPALTFHDCSFISFTIGIELDAKWIVIKEISVAIPLNTIGALEDRPSIKV